ncbi:MAG: serine/threonine-protein phosphatase, partial [Solobacterium sp.]|nr:serine/threonine-protein phosphatase [Solobacterium sp.]
MIALGEYPAYQWLVRYWHDHAADLDIEYDADYGAGTKTEEKARLLNSRHPELQLKYATVPEIKALPEEDQKLYAEITYSWLITRVNQIKQTYHVDYLFGVLTDDTFSSQFFLFSGSEKGLLRGTKYEEAYTLGKTVTVSDEQMAAMRHATQNYKHLADAGSYVDYYAYMDTIDEYSLLIGMTYNQSSIRTNVESRTMSQTAQVMLYEIILAALCLAGLYFSVLKPLKKVQSNIRKYKEEKDSENVIWSLAEVRPPNEIGQLSEDVSEMAMEMDNYMNSIRAITAEKERIGVELSLAKRIQASMMPHVFPPFPDRSEFDIYATMDPAKGVGGDFFDFFLIDEDHLCLVIADVSGKGIPAALFMMVSKIILQSCAMLGRSAAEILTKTNEAICSNNVEQMFITVWLGILEISTGKLTAANAGHEYPILKNPDGTFEVLKDKHGFVIGGMEDIQYKEYEVQLQPGSKLFVYTDGAPEATDCDNCMFGIERMLKTLNDDPDACPEQILKNMQNE